MKDQFRAAEQIGQINVPVLMLHGEQDRVIPIAFAEKLYELISAPNRLFASRAEATSTSIRTALRTLSAIS